LGYPSSLLYAVHVDQRIPAVPRQRLLALLREIRAEAGLRQVDLAKRLRKPQSFVSKYESGERRLDLIELRQVCHALGISLEELVRRFEASI
jgi:transcriptional regulator with XRE-family HTH domain